MSPSLSVSYRSLEIDSHARSVSRTVEDASNGAKHPDTVNQEILKDRLGSILVYCSAQRDGLVSDVGAWLGTGPSD